MNDAGLGRAPTRGWGGASRMVAIKDRLERVMIENEKLVVTVSPRLISRVGIQEKNP